MFRAVFFSLNSIIFSLSLQSMVSFEEDMIIDDKHTTYPLLELPPEIRRRIIEFFIYNNKFKLEFTIQKPTSWTNIKNLLWPDIQGEEDSHNLLLMERCQQILPNLLNTSYESMSFCYKKNDVLITTLENEIFYWDTQKHIIQKCERKLSTSLNAFNFGPVEGTAFATSYISEAGIEGNRERACLWDLNTGRQLLQGELYGHGYQIESLRFISPVGMLLTDGIDNANENHTLWKMSYGAEGLTPKKKALIAMVLVFHTNHDSKFYAWPMSWLLK